MGDSRTEILRSIRQQLVEAVEHPGCDGPWIQYEDPEQQFREVLEGVGGHLEHVATLTDVERRLGELDEYRSGLRVVSAVVGVGPDAAELDSVEDPHLLEDVDFAVLPGRFCVAENAAVWMTFGSIPQRTVCFLSQHLAFVVPSRQIVHNMHEAYERIRPAEDVFGVFVSGPSKTADIEQSLVIGAHGARSLTVFLVDELEAAES